MNNQQAAIALCRRIEAICPEYGFHVALTGGCLYKEGDRKDMDILFYRIRQVPYKDCRPDEMFDRLASEMILVKESGFGWCIKTTHMVFHSGGTFERISVDCFFPEELRGPNYQADNPHG